MLDDPLLRERLEELQALLQEILGFQESISSQEAEQDLDGGGAGVRSPLQIELILRSLNQSSESRRGKASP